MPETKKPLTLVLGASDNPGRYSYVAVERLRRNGYPVIAVGKRSGMIGDTPIITEIPLGEPYDTVTLYLNRQHQQAYIDIIMKLHPRRIIFNPGTENPEWAAQARAAGIGTEEACTLVLLSTGQYYTVGT